MSYTPQEMWKRKNMHIYYNFFFFKALSWLCLWTLNYHIGSSPVSRIYFRSAANYYQTHRREFCFSSCIICKKPGVAWKWHIPLSSVLPPGSSLGAELKLRPICHYVLVSRWSLCLFPKLAWKVHAFFYIERTWEYNSLS